MTAVDTAATRSRPTGVQTARDLTLLLGRVGLAVLMIAHAKLEYDYGGGSIAGVGRLFAQAGVPLASLTGPANLLLETIGGIALILGLAVPAVGVLIGAQHARRLGAGPPDGALRGRPHRPGDGDSDWAAEPGARRLRLRALRARPPDRQSPPGAPSDVSGTQLDQLSRPTVEPRPVVSRSVVTVRGTGSRRRRGRRPGGRRRGLRGGRD